MERHWQWATLIGLVLFVFVQVAGFGFLNYDDDGYVTANPPVLKGLTGESLGWAFTSLSRFYWHPLTWISLMADVSLFGPSPGAMHLVNVGVHLATTLLLFFFLRRLTGEVGRSFLVSALFSVHPLRVESVAWIAERKDVLSAFLIVATLLVYERYARQPSRLGYLTVSGLFVLACMAKPMAVTVPILMLLLDLWPLRRRALLEKAPLLGIAAGFAVITYVGAREMGALQMLEPPSLATRLQNAVWSLGWYLRQTFVPLGLSIVYPYPRSFPGVWWIVVVLAGATGAAIWQWRARPWILTGWLWFVVGVAPTLGLVQAGVQARADRFTYIPHVGLLMAVVWLAAEFLPRRFHQAAAVAAILALAVLANRQVSAWRNSETVFAQALANTSDNWLAEYKYGLALLERNDTASAEKYMRRAAALDPSDPHSRFQLGRLAAAAGRHEQASQYFAETIRLKPNYGDAHYSLGSMLATLNQVDEAVRAFDRARAAGLLPEWEYQAHIGSGVLLARSGRLADAERHFRAAVALQPQSEEARRNLALAQEQLRHTINGKSPDR
ncbi:MAG TPA: tetratricopeptide repeat protein [Bryobacteraceae bacterium]|nr:tetratricopeptide repeat protein [Bryobacteraceae bacterium]